MATDALLKSRSWRAMLHAAVVLAALTVTAGNLRAHCGSTVIGEKTQPAAIQGMGSEATLRAWAAGSAGTASISDPCTGNGCAALDASPLCEASGDCIALSGIEWLNGSCTTAGFLPAASIVLAEATTSSDGGRWAAVELDHNAGDANFDLDAAQDRICSGCSSEASPLIGAGQRIGVSQAGQSGNVITLDLAWTAPDTAAEALSDASLSLVKAYSIWYRRVAEGSLPPMDGSPAGWTRAADVDATQSGGYSTDTAAQIEIDLGTSSDFLWVAVGLVFDGSGDPGTDANSISSSVISRPSLVYPMDLFSDGFETGDTTMWSGGTP